MLMRPPVPHTLIRLLAGALLAAAPAVWANEVTESPERIKDGVVAGARHVGQTAQQGAKAAGAAGRAFGRGVRDKTREIGRSPGKRFKAAFREVKDNVKRSAQAVKAGRADPPGARQGPDPTR
jgi:Zn-dependent alcohol dehydrogenase